MMMYPKENPIKMIGRHLRRVGETTSEWTRSKLPRQFLKKYATKVSDMFDTFVEHARYRLHRSQTSGNIVHYDSKTLEMKFTAILAATGPDVPKILASDLVNNCSVRNIKKALRMCGRSLKEKGTSPSTKINAMQFLVVVALSNEYNAYRVAVSSALNVVYRLGTISSERYSHPLFSRCVNRAQLLKCAMYAKNVIDLLSKVESFDVALQKPVPFGVRLLLSKCNKFRRQYMEAGAAALDSDRSLNDLKRQGEEDRSPMDANGYPTPKSFHSRMKEIGYRVTLVEDEMRELGIGRGRSPKSAKNEDNDNQDSEVRAVELVSILYYIKGEAEKLMAEVVGSEDFTLHVQVRSLLDRIEILEVECHGTYMDESPIGDLNPLQITLNDLQRNVDSSDDEFHTGRERMDISYIVSLAKGDRMSTYTYKSARTEYTAKETFTRASSIIGNESDNPTGRADAYIRDHDEEEASQLDDLNSTLIQKLKVIKGDLVKSNSNTKSRYVDIKDMKTGSSDEARSDRWAVFDDSYEGETERFTKNPVKGVRLQTNSEQDTVDQSERGTTQPNVELSPSKGMDSGNFGSHHAPEDTPHKESKESTTETPEAKFKNKADDTDGAITSAMGVIGMIRNFLGAESDISTPTNSMPNISAQILQSTPNVHAPLSPMNSVIKANNSGDRNKHSKGDLLHDGTQPYQPALIWGSDSDNFDEEIDIDTDESRQQNRGNTFSNMGEIRQIVVSGTPRIYRNDDIEVTFKQRLMSEGTGKVVDCHLILTNTGDTTIENVRFDFLNFEHFPVHLSLSSIPDDGSIIRPADSMDVCFRLYPLAPFIGLPKVKIITKSASTESNRKYILYLPLPISSFLVPELWEDIKMIETLQRQSKIYFLIRNTADFKRVTTLATLDNRLARFKLDSEPKSVYLMASLHQSMYENDRNDCFSKLNVLLKLEEGAEPTSFSIYVYSKSELLAGAVAQLYKYLFHNQGDVYGV